MSVSLILLNGTLRLHDNPLLHAASGRKAAVVILNKAAFFGRQYGLVRANLQRLQQQLALINELKAALASQQIGLITLFGNTVDCISQLAVQLQASALYCAEPVAAYECSAIQQLAGRINVVQLDCNSLLGDRLRPDLHDLPHSFTPFRKQREPLLAVSKPTTSLLNAADWLSPAATELCNSVFSERLQQYQPLPQSAPVGESAALARLEYFIWQGQHILHYKDTRNQLLGTDYASFLSAYLAQGSLSVRWLWQQIIAFETQVAANESTYWLKFELLWREFFRWQSRKYANRWFSKGAIKGPLNFSPPNLSLAQQTAFNRWCQANTGVDFVDANMQLLNQTGLMSNRGRQNVASFLIHDLGIDWRLGAAYFEQRLLDYDCASNWGNWAYIAGTGNSSERKFNLQKQAQLYDADGSFVRAMQLTTNS
ncbi:DASH family cryptochrome [Rheinheimera maricola]|uniref:Cryptochrome DASH n=1 Tax=Rheinheimera maricola TaxID=2793282 RepID=A0ABS7XAJ2_9GAMM|nr:DASH family cryptochrome [Rheinheimera maricola]MBZ9612547.1 DASH family cryptochrome [Rheinheimera maricola]